MDLFSKRNHTITYYSILSNVFSLLIGSCPDKEDN